MSTITIPASVLIDGQWRTAIWTAERRIDTDTVQFTASVKLDDRDTSVAIYITDGDLRALRQMAGEDIATQQPISDTDSRLSRIESLIRVALNNAQVEVIQREREDGEIRRRITETERNLNVIKGQIHAAERDISTVRTGVQGELTAFRQMVTEALDHMLTTLSARIGELNTRVSKLQAEHVSPADLQTARDFLAMIERIEEDDKRQSEFIQERLNTLDDLIQLFKAQLTGDKNAAG